MQPLANKFIELLESKQLLSDDVIVELRRHVAESKVKLSPELIAKLLVDNGHLTKFQASKLVTELAQSGDTTSAPTKPKLSSAEPELGFAPASNVADIVVDDDEIVGVEAVDVVEDAVPVVDAAFVTEYVEVSPVAEVAAIEAIDLSSIQSSSRSQRGGSPAFEPPSRTVKVDKPKSNPWDSFRILGIGTALALVLVALVLLVLWLVRGSAEEALKMANERYEQRSYEDASNMYRDFAKNWPTNEKASYAKVRSVLSAMRRDVETGSNPVIALRTAEQVLPEIEGESSLSEQQGDLTGVLIALAEKFNDRIDATKNSDQRREMMAEMDKLMTIINDSKYVGSAQRTQQAPTLQKIEESRARLVREIRRDDELAVALKEMDSLLEANEVLKAYRVRKELIDKYPLLEVNEEVKQRVLKASQTQRALVKDGSSPARLLDSAPPADAPKSYMFAHRYGLEIPGLDQTIVYYRVKGTVYAIKASKGEILWNKFVGRGLDSNPIRLSDSGNPDVIVSEAESGNLHRILGESGAIKWTAAFGEAIHPAAIDGEDVFVTSLSGLVSCLDAVSGQTKWQKQLPQPTSVGVGVAPGKQLIYQTADHSNIYVLDRRDGSCKDVHYQGHLAGSIKVPPALVFGHLFVFDNISANSARIRILQVGEDGLKQAQEPMVVDGNIIVPPLIDRRQLLVQSDMGNTVVLDIEPSSKDKVTRIASVPKNLDSPRQVWTAFQKNFIWLAENRLARFDLVVSSGKMDRKWIQNDGDQFVGPLQLFGSTLIHARQLKGNQGVRVSAVNADDGVKIWEVDLGEPISMIVKKQQGYAAISSSGSYYSISNKPLVSQADVAAGEGKSQKWFSNPVSLSPTQSVLLNRSNPREFALYSESDTPLQALQVLALPIGNANPSCEAVTVGDKAVVGLESGQLLMFDPTTGLIIGSPYQPEGKPNKRVIWNQPAVIPSSRSLIVASDLMKIVRFDASESLRKLSEEALESPLLGPLVVVGNNVVGVSSNANGDTLMSFNSLSLAATQGSALEGRLVAGPFATNSGGLVQTDQKLIAFDENGKATWSVAFPNSQIVRTPVLAGDRLVIANRLGQIWVIDAASGQVTGNVDLGQSLSTEPLVIDKRILVGSDEGSILATLIPTELLIPGASQ
jgi:outer membrane protein assembly factor BamB